MEEYCETLTCYYNKPCCLHAAKELFTLPPDLTPEERKNIDLAREYMRIAYTPGEASAKAVSHLCANGNRFVAPTTFPGVNTLEDYAEQHGKMMEKVTDLHFVSQDIIFAKGDHVAIRYTAEGTHNGKWHGLHKATGRKAQWTACALFTVKDGKLMEFVKEWNKLPMWEQLGWPIRECHTTAKQWEAGQVSVERVGDLTDLEQKNVDLARDYMRAAYTPGEASANAVAHFCAPNNRFVAPTTFPGVHTLEEYAEQHGKMMEEVTDLRFVSQDIIFAKGDHVVIRYTAEGTHNGKPHGDIQPTGRRAQWTACAIFTARDGKLVEFVKEWNKLPMWEQFGWPIEECFTHVEK